MAMPTLGFPIPTMEGNYVQYSLIEKQLAAVHAALLATEAITGTAPVTVRTTYPITGWVRDRMAKPCSGMAQTPTLAKWGAYLQQRSSLFTGSLQAELQEVLGPVIYVDKKSTVPVPLKEMEASPFQEGQAPIPSDARYAEGSGRDQPVVWTTIAIQSETDTIWFDTSVEENSQRAEL